MPLGYYTSCLLFDTIRLSLNLASNRKAAVFIITLLNHHLQIRKKNCEFCKVYLWPGG